MYSCGVPIRKMSYSSSYLYRFDYKVLLIQYNAENMGLILLNPNSFHVLLKVSSILNIVLLQTLHTYVIYALDNIKVYVIDIIFVILIFTIANTACHLILKQFKTSVFYNSLIM